MPTERQQSVTPPDYTSALERLRRRRNRALLLFLGYLPLFATLAQLTSWLGIRDIFLPYLAGAYCAAVLFANIRLAFSRCPRCDECFFRRFPHSRLGNSCLHCGLSFAEPALRLSRSVRALFVAVLSLVSAGLVVLAAAAAYAAVFRSGGFGAIACATIASGFAWFLARYARKVLRAAQP